MDTMEDGDDDHEVVTRICDKDDDCFDKDQDALDGALSQTTAALKSSAKKSKKLTKTKGQVVAVPSTGRPQDDSDSDEERESNF